MIRTASLSPIVTAIDIFPTNIAVLDADGIIIHVNDSWLSFARQNGLVDEVPREGTDYLSVAAASNEQSAHDAVEGIIRVLNGETNEFELTYPCHSPDEKRWFSMRVSGFDVDEKRYALVIHVNITDQAEREHQLELFDAIFTNQIGLALLFDEEGEVLLGNQRFYDLTEQSPAAVPGTHFQDLESLLPVRSDEIESVQNLLADVLKSELEIASMEADLLIGGGDAMTADVRIIPVEIGDRITGAILTVRDVIKWKDREDKLRLFESAVEGASDMIAAIGADYSYLFANKTYRYFYQIKQEELGETYIEDVLSEENLENVREHVDRALEGERIEFSKTMEGPDGDVHPLEVRYYPIRLRNDSIVGAVAVVRDMTLPRERERHLLVLDRMLRHNMHNDMNIIEGYADMIAEQGNDEIGNLGEKIQTAATDMLTTIGKQRKIIEMLSKAPEFRRLDIANIVGRVVTDAELEFPQAHISFEAPPEVIIRTISQIEKAVYELVENAVVHSESSEPKVAVRIVDRGDTVAIKVADDGEGIPQDDRDVLTGDREIGPLYHGSGMGLWMVNWIVSRSNGSMHFRSRDSGGSVVTVQLPKQ